MRVRTALRHAKSGVGALAILSALCEGAAVAKDYDVTVSIPVNTRGIDMRQAAGSEKLYVRLQQAAYVACTRGDRVNLKPVDNLKGCYEAALGNAVRTVNSPLLTQLYLQTHTPRQAAVHGIGAQQVAAK